MSDIDISAEEFRQRKYARSTTPNEERPRCPECGKFSAMPKAPGSAKRNHEEDWACNLCHAHFNEPLRDDGGSE